MHRVHYFDTSAHAFDACFEERPDLREGDVVVILAEGVEEDGLGLAIMNRLRKAAGYQIITLENGSLHLKNNVNLPSFMLQ